MWSVVQDACVAYYVVWYLNMLWSFTFTRTISFTLHTRYSLTQKRNEQGDGGEWEVSKRDISPLYCDFPVFNPSRVGKKVGMMKELWCMVYSVCCLVCCVILC
ncbi:hypothetical protein EON63_09410 [archaeon]|nr:MAG: hypothetical protein EON63_09410 [archaeon]